MEKADPEGILGMKPQIYKRGVKRRRHHSGGKRGGWQKTVDRARFMIRYASLSRFVKKTEGHQAKSKRSNDDIRDVMGGKMGIKNSRCDRRSVIRET